MSRNEENGRHLHPVAFSPCIRKPLAYDLARRQRNAKKESNMDKHAVRVKRLETTEPKRVIDVDVIYFGHNRGYYLHFQPKEIGVGLGGFESERFMIGSGKCVKIENAQRFNRRRLEELASQGEKLPKYAEWLKLVCEEEGITLTGQASGQAPRGWESVTA